MSAVRLARHVHQDAPATPATITPHIHRKGEIVVLDTQQRAGKARHLDRLHCGSAGYEAGVIRTEAWSHIGRDMRRDAPPVSMRRQHYAQQHNSMGWFEWVGHEAVVRIGVAAIVCTLVSLAKGWI